MVSQFLEQSIPIDNVPCLPAFQLTEQRLCGGHVVSASLQHCDLLPSSASVQENCAVGLGASARARPGSKSSNCRRRSRPQSGDDFRSDASQVPPRGFRSTRINGTEMIGGPVGIEPLTYCR